MKKLKGLDKYIIFCFFMLISYTVLAYITIIFFGVSLDVLTSLFFGVFGGEILLCALIKKYKLKGGSKKDTENKYEGGGFG